MPEVASLTIFHVIISLVAIVAGIALAYGLLTLRRFDRWTLVFMVTTALTLVTGFLFPYGGLTPAINVGILCSAIFIPTALGRYVFHMNGAWRIVFVVGALMLFYFNCLVLIVQSFQKIPALNALAPLGNEPPILAAQSALLVVFIIIGILSVRRFRPALLTA
ncbi:hypothetical protein [Rhizobium sp. BK251]|uniref:hypothetical protein n=1 Tax=Rhizobium sp. BK251 TaxID=2512125 RepID=UPI00104EAA7B|nr:hypothetical protein [Rhizobium sp. BK251]TCL69541.1 hypothetical protein EV286_108113 [Rhizobium sp. BK251]